MASELEQVLENLLVPDNNVIQQATQQLQVAFKDPAIVPALCTTLATAQNPQVRQFAAILLRRKITKVKNWSKLSPDIKNNIRQNVLQILLQESERVVRNSIAQLVGSIAKHDLQENQWPELLQFLQQYTKSEQSEHREMGMYVLSIVSESAWEQLQPHLPSLLALFADTLDDRVSPNVPFYTIQSLANLVDMVGTDEVKLVQTLIPKILVVIRLLVQSNEEQGREAMELFSQLAECEVSVLAPHIKSVLELCLEVAATKDLSSGVRVEALSFVSFLCQQKKKVILKHKLIGPILHIIFPIMCTESSKDEEEEEDDYECSESSSSPVAVAGWVVDNLARYLPPNKLVPQLMPLVEPALQSENPFHRKAAFVALAVISEGCSDHIRNKHLEGMLQCVCKGLQDPHPVVKDSAMFALGQFSEHLQPEISKYAQDLLPLMFDYLAKTKPNSERGREHITKIYFALETYCENLGKDLLPYLPTLMEKLLTSLQTTQSQLIKSLTISAIGATANAAKEDLLPYFPQIIEHLKHFLTPTDNEDLLKLQLEAIDTLAVLARTIGRENFLPLAAECMGLGMGLLADATDPDLRRCVYCLFAAISLLLKEEMAQYLPSIVEPMLEAVQSMEGITANYKEEDEGMFQIFEDEDIEDEDDDDNEELVGFSMNVENPYMDEKEDAVSSLGELAVNVGEPFMGYMERSFDSVFKLLGYFLPDVIRAAAVAIGQFCIAVNQVMLVKPSAEGQTALQNMLSVTLPKYIEIVQKDSTHTTVLAVLETIKEMLEKIKAPMLAENGFLDSLCTTVKMVFQNKTACQGSGEDDDGDMEDQEGEYDSMVVEQAGEVLPAVARLVGPDTFAPYFAGFLPEILRRLKDSSTVSERSFAVGTLGEIVDACGKLAPSFVEHLYPIVVAGVKDEDDEVCSNSVYTLGVLALTGGDSMVPQYPFMLKAMSDVSNGKNGRDLRITDNVCGAVCRMIMTHPESLPMEQVFPVVLQCLPLKEDFDENKTVLTCVGKLYDGNHPQVINHLPQLLGYFAHVLGTEQINKEMENLTVQMVQKTGREHPQVLQTALSSLAPELATKLNHCMTIASQ